MNFFLIKSNFLEFRIIIINLNIIIFLVFFYL